MSTAIKVPKLPQGLNDARVGHWYKQIDQVVARGEVLVELIVSDHVIPILAPKAGILEKIFFPQGSQVKIDDILAIIRTGLPDLVWDEQEKTLILVTYRAPGVTTSMEYDLRQALRVGEGKYAEGYGSGLALPQETAARAQAGMGHDAAQLFKSHPAFAESSQMSGDFKDPRVCNPANEEAANNPQYRFSLTPTPDLGPSNAPTFKR